MPTEVTSDARDHAASSPALQLGVRILVLALRVAALVTTAWALDFALFPGRRRVPLHRALWALLYPLAYSVLTAVRGSSLTWYPYVFFDPEWVGGYAGVLAYAAVLAAALVAVAATLVLVTRLPTPVAEPESDPERG